eukprot:gb/GECH01005015.1/.p1 GENE.gb/GECH01005015.1/~~gb/GECH01005015.1/.p1  ORF type:complete len:174 (+),score=45.32 gb/GECH01005015.1/:1-522(+)
MALKRKTNTTQNNFSSNNLYEIFSCIESNELLERLALDQNLTETQKNAIENEYLKHVEDKAVEKLVNYLHQYSIQQQKEFFKKESYNSQLQKVEDFFVKDHQLNIPTLEHSLTPYNSKNNNESNNISIKHEFTNNSTKFTQTNYLTQEQYRMRVIMDHLIPNKKKQYDKKHQI